jgi:hypothetical protein
LNISLNRPAGEPAESRSHSGWFVFQSILV